MHLCIVLQHTWPACLEMEHICFYFIIKVGLGNLRILTMHVSPFSVIWHKQKSSIGDYEATIDILCDSQLFTDQLYYLCALPRNDRSAGSGTLF